MQSTPNKSRSGSGEIRGVIEPESSNNAKEGGGLVPTLLFDVPGSGSMAIFIGAVALLGSGQIEVGPAMPSRNLDITDAIVWLPTLANVVGTVICIAASGGIARLTTDKRTVREALANYPTPISGYDVQYTRLIQEREAVREALAAPDRPGFTPTPRIQSPGARIASR